MGFKFLRSQSRIVKIKSTVFRQIFIIVSIEIFRREGQETRRNFSFVKIMAVGLITLQEKFLRSIVRIESLFHCKSLIQRSYIINNLIFLKQFFYCRDFTFQRRIKRNPYCCVTLAQCLEKTFRHLRQEDCVGHDKNFRLRIKMTSKFYIFVQFGI